MRVVAEAPGAEHLEHRQVCSVADLVEVGGPQAPLRVDQARSLRVRFALQVRDEGVHAGGDEQHGVVRPGRYQRAGEDALVAALAEVVDESVAGVLGVHGGFPFGLMATGKGADEGAGP